ncbi:MAG: winged helix-turn-helix domain-containing protein, partial [Candidatus Bipolaricaulia bacterium]
MKQMNDNDLGLQVKLLGHFEAWRNDEPLPPQAWPQRKTQTLLKILLTERGRIFTQDQLIDALFPDLDPDNATQNLYKQISELRRTLEPNLNRGTDSQFVLRVGGGYCFSENAPCWIDTKAFHQHVESARELEQAGRWSQALEQYQQSIELYRGDYLAEDLYEEWSIPPREHWRELYLT